MPQLTYDFEMKAAVAGMVVDLQNANIKSRAAEVDIDFGLGLVQGTDPEKQVKLPTATGQKFEGISVEQWTVRQDINTQDGVYKAKDNMAVLRQGLIWVRIDQDVQINDPVYVRHTSTSGKEGYFRKDADTDKADLVPSAIFRSTATADEGIAQVEINIP